MNTATRGWLNGFIGVAIFSGSLPATRLAVSVFDPVFLTAARATIAALAASAILLAFRVRLPDRSCLPSLIVTAAGVVIGFPLLTALALKQITAAHSVVYVGLLPLATAIFGVIRGGERPAPAFWLFSMLGSAMVVGFAFTGGRSTSLSGDALMVGAIVVCGLGYAEGATLSRALGGWQVISWALVIALPFTAALAAATRPSFSIAISWSAGAGLAYVSLFSMLIGFFFWYKGLAQGGTAAVGQLQLLQPFMGLSLSSLLLGEVVDRRMILATVAVAACVAGAKVASRHNKRPYLAVAPATERASIAD